MRASTRSEALAYFDGLPAVKPEEMLGRWRGSGLPTGSPLDGLLEAYGWYGKEFLDDETVHPLLFADRSGRPRPVDPALLPVSVLRDYAGFLNVWPLRRAFAPSGRCCTPRRPKARLREVSTAASSPRRWSTTRCRSSTCSGGSSDDVRLGAMDMRGLPSPFLFVLRRD